MMPVTIFQTCLLASTLFIILPCVTSKDNNWDFLKFTQEWPPSVCVNEKGWDKVSHSCKIGANVTTWTVHGLWPTRLHEELPNFCNNSYHYDNKAIGGIMTEMLKYWPNLFAGTPQDELWKHEWQKHGTCAVNLPALNSQYKYFSMGLKLNRRYDLTSVFQKAGIVPSSTEMISLEKINKALSPWFSPPPNCEFSNGKPYLTQLSLCLDKSFNPIDCNKVDLPSDVKSAKIKHRNAEILTEKCPSEVYIPPVHHT